MTKFLLIALLIAITYGVILTIYHRSVIDKTMRTTEAIVNKLVMVQNNLFEASNAVAYMHEKLSRLENERKSIPAPTVATNILDVARDLDDLNMEIEQRR